MSELRYLGIADLKDKYGLEVMVETGCCTGDGLRYAAELGFAERYSCDLNPEAVELCQDLGEVHWASSTDFLRAILPKIAGKRVLYWLDAHYPESYSKEPGAKFPLPDELRILAGKQGIEHDVILCDDARVIRDPANPTYNPDNYLGHLPVEYYYVDMPLSALTGIVPLRHRIITEQAGVLVFEP